MKAKRRNTTKTTRALARKATEAKKRRTRARRPRSRAITVLMRDVQVKRTRWLWENYIPLGKLTVLDADPDKGKSAVSLDIAARVTTGTPFPDGATCEPAGVVILSAEDDLEETIRPRLDAAGGDVSRIIFLAGVRAPGGGAVSPSLSDLDPLGDAIDQVGAKLVIVDTLTDFFGSRSLLDPQSVRSVLVPLAAFARKKDCAVLLVRHFTKTGRTIMSKGAGSTAIVAVCRSGLFVVKDPDNDGRRILASFKHNLSPMEPAALAFRFGEANGAARIDWEGVAPWRSEALLAASMESEKAKSARREAREFLQTFLQLGPVPVDDVTEAGRAHGIAPRTLERARRDLDVKSERRGGLGKAGRWYLRLVEPLADPPDGKSETVTTDKGRQKDDGGVSDEEPIPPLPKKT